MNLMGKILTLLIFVMSLAFLIVAFMVAASHQNWRQQAENNQQIANQRLADQRSIQAEIAKKDQQLQQERVARTLLIAQVESQWQQARTLYESKEKEVAAALADLQQKTQTLKEAEERLKEQDGQVESLSTQVTELTQNIAAEHAKLIELQNKAFELEGVVQALERTKAAMANSLAKSTKVLKANGLTEDSLTSAIPPILRGEVMAVNEDLIKVNLGTDDGLNVGHTLDIYRSGRFVGSATVYTAHTNDAVARIIPEMTNSAVLANDLVTTEWSRPVARNGN